MPKTKTVNRIWLGDLGLADRCAGNGTSVQLFVREHPSGEVDTSNQITHSAQKSPVPATPGKVSWSIPTTAFQEGKGYSFQIAYPTGCRYVNHLTWAHEEPVNPGPSRCTQGPRADGNYGQPALYRMWHVNQVSDSTTPCASSNPGASLFSPDMPSGWLVTQVRRGVGSVLTATGWTTRPPAASACSAEGARAGASPELWRNTPGMPGHFDYVCMWPDEQHAPFGQTTPSGWHYGLPWRSAAGAMPRDADIKLDLEPPSLVYDPAFARVGRSLMSSDTVKRVTGDATGWSFSVRGNAGDSPLPSGISLSSNGELTGTPAATPSTAGLRSSTTNHVVRLSRGEHTVDAPLRLTVRPQPTPTLAQRFRPIMRFDSDENWRPLNIESYLDETFADGQPGVRHSICPRFDQPGTNCSDIAMPAGTPAWQKLWSYRDGLGAPEGTGPYINVHGEGDTIADFRSPRLSTCTHPTDVLDCDTGPNTAMYWHEVSEPGGKAYTFIDYQTFYRYNKFQFGDHEWDTGWVTVALPSGATNPVTFDWVSMSSHHDTWRYLRDALQCDDNGPGSCGTEAVPDLAGVRPVVFTANGGHANLPERCTLAGATCARTTADGTTILPPEKRYDGERSWGANNDATTLRELPEPKGWGAEILQPAWTDWPGRWGTDADSPTSTGSRGPSSHFYRPDQDVCSERGTDEETNCPGGEGARNAATPTALSSSTTVSRECRPWAGPHVKTLVCDPGLLKDALKRGSLGRRGQIALEGKSSEANASAPGVAQLLGDPVTGDEEIVLRGPIEPETQIMVLSKAGDTRAEAVFEPPEGLQRALRLRLRDRRDPRSVVLESDRGERTRPTEIETVRDSSR